MSANKELLSIKDFAKITNIKESTLRYYDDLGLFHPAVRADNGYRYYTPVQIITINSIKVLHDLGIPIKQITEIYSKRSPKTVSDFLIKHEITIDDEIARLTRAKNIIGVYKRLILRGLNADTNKIYEEYRSDLPIILGDMNDWTNTTSFYRPFSDYLLTCKERGIEIDYPVGGYFESFDNMSLAPGKPERFFSIIPNAADRIPGGMYVVGYAKGYYGESGDDLVVKIRAYLDENDLRTQGAVFHIYIHDEISVAKPKDYISCLLVPVIKNS